MWEPFEAADGSIHLKLKGDAPRRTRTVGKVWRPNPKAVREMERRRLGKVKGGAADDGGEEAPALAAEPSGDAVEDK